MAKRIFTQKYPFFPMIRGRVPIHTGDIVAFGSYSFTADGKKYPILWHVIIGGCFPECVCMKLISVFGVDAVAYSERDRCTWKDSGLRKWLNTDFFISAFSDEEKQLICDKKHPSEDDYRFDECKVDGDPVSMLNDFDTGTFLEGDSNYCHATPYAARMMNIEEDPAPLYIDVSIPTHNGIRIDDPELPPGSEPTGTTYERRRSADFFWVPPANFTLSGLFRDPDPAEQKPAEPLDCVDKVAVWLTDATPTYEVDDHYVLQEYKSVGVRRHFRSIRHKALARPVINLFYRPSEEEKNHPFADSCPSFDRSELEFVFSHTAGLEGYSFV